MDITDSDNEIRGPMAVDRVGDRTSRNKPIPRTDRGEDAEAIPLATLTYVGDLPTGVLPGFPQRRSRTSCVLWNNPLVAKASGPIPKYPTEPRKTLRSGREKHPLDVLRPPSPRWVTHGQLSHDKETRDTDRSYTPQHF